MELGTTLVYPVPGGPCLLKAQSPCITDNYGKDFKWRKITI